jgi:hypothetical protein
VAKSEELLGRTYDQQLEIVGEDITKVDIAPNRRVAGEIVFEPMGTGVRVTARDGSHKVLWGFVASSGMLDQVHCLVAIYDPLARLIVEELEKCALPAPTHGDPVTEAERTIDNLEETIKWLKESLHVRHRSQAAVDRATLIARIASEALRQITLDAEMLKGMKPKSERDQSEGG